MPLPDCLQWPLALFLRIVRTAETHKDRLKKSKRIARRIRITREEFGIRGFTRKQTIIIGVGHFCSSAIWLSPMPPKSTVVVLAAGLGVMAPVAAAVGWADNPFAFSI